MTLTDRFVGDFALTDPQRVFLRDVEACGGYEVHKDDWADVEALITIGYGKWTSGARGPDSAWKRFEL